MKLLRIYLIALLSYPTAVIGSEYKLDTEIFLDTFEEEFTYRGCAHSHYYLYDKPILSVRINERNTDGFNGEGTCLSQSELTLLDETAEVEIRNISVSPKWQFNKFPELQINVFCNKISQEQFNHISYDVTFPLMRTRQVLQAAFAESDLTDVINIGGRKIEPKSPPLGQRTVSAPVVPDANLFVSGSLTSEFLFNFKQQITLIAGIYKTANPAGFESCCDTYSEGWEDEKPSGCDKWKYDYRK